MPDVLVNIKGMGLMRIAQQSQPQATAGIQSRVNKQNAFDDRVQGVLSGIGNQIADVAINDEGELNNPAQLKAALDNKFQEVRNFTDMVTQGLTPTQKAAFLTMGVNGLGDITGLAADIEMYITDPESRTWFNAMMSSAGVAGGAVSISPSMAAMLPIIRKNIDAWHGSPHKFDAFSMSRIGTGEGAQAYGHGLYFAENKSVSENYAKVLGDDMNAYQGAMDDVNRAVSPHTDFQNSEYMVNWAYEGGYDPKKESLYDFMVKEIDEGGYTLEQPDGVDIQGILKAAQDPEVIKATDRMVMPVEPTLYNVDLKVSPDDLLDWDAPVNKKMQDLLDELAVSSGRGDKWLTPQESWADYTGAQAYDNLGDYFTSAEEASKFLNEKGIPGIRYLDGSSRPKSVVDTKLQRLMDKHGNDVEAVIADTMRGYHDTPKNKAAYEQQLRDTLTPSTRNFVIFDDSLIDIKTRNGEVLTPVQREAAVSEMMGGGGNPGASAAERYRLYREGNLPKPENTYDPAEIANRYPQERGIGNMGVKNNRAEDGNLIGEDGKPNYFVSKDLSPEERAVQQARNAAQDDIKAGNYDPFFPLNERFDVDPSNYDIQGNTLTDSVYKTQAKIDEHTELLNTKDIKTRLREAYEKGDSEMARNWYSMGQLEKAFIDELGETEGRAMFRKRFAESMAATTGGADPTANLLTAAYTNYLEVQGVTDFPVLSTDIPHPQGGRYIGGNMKMANKFANTDAELSASVSPKRFNFAANFLGDSSRATIDEQMSHLYDPKLNAPKKGWYGIMEQTLDEVAAEIGVDPMNFQDVAWAGSKGTDGKPMIEHVNEAIERTARVTGKSPDDIVRDSLVNATHPLYGLATAGLLGTTAALREDRNRAPDI